VKSSEGRKAVEGCESCCWDLRRGNELRDVKGEKKRREISRESKKKGNEKRVKVRNGEKKKVKKRKDNIYWMNGENRLLRKLKKIMKENWKS
jgi:hypothetical protein